MMGNRFFWIFRNLFHRLRWYLQVRTVTVRPPSGPPVFDRAQYQVPSHSITSDAAHFMYDYIKEHRLCNGIEIGSKYGWSGMWLARALAENGGRLLMIDRKLRGRLMQNFHRAGIRNATLVIGDSTDPEVARIVRHYVQWFGPFDFAFIDGDHSYEVCRSDYLLVRSCAAATVHIFLDDVFTAKGVRRVFKGEPARRKYLVRGFRPEARRDPARDVLGIHVVRPGRGTRSQTVPESPSYEDIAREFENALRVFWGLLIVTGSGQIGTDVVLYEQLPAGG